MARLPKTAALLLAIAVAPLSAISDNVPPPRGQSSATFRSRTDLVVVQVTVVDKKTGFVSGLDRDDFLVYEDNRPQPIRFFLSEDTPVTVGLVIDNSASMRTRRDEVIAAGLAFARASHPKDEIFTVNFNERVWLGLEPTHKFTSNLPALHEALQLTTARGQTALFDAILFALAHLERGTAPKKALVVLSDGDDNASAANVNQVLDAAHRSNAVIYTIGLFGGDRAEANLGLLEAGGRHWRTKTDSAEAD
ncbi:MAG: VWA domain-containing protein [Acidobacteria bacterium]|nr:VWA domain-containing protein [Acidobacteriota bacterium]